MLNVDSCDKNKNSDQSVHHPVVDRAQAKHDLRSKVAGQIKPSDLYTLGQRIEDQVDRFSDRPFLIYGDLALIKIKKRLHLTSNWSVETFDMSRRPMVCPFESG